MKLLEDELGTLVKEFARFATQVEIKEGMIADEQGGVEDLSRVLEDLTVTFGIPRRGRSVS